MKVHFRERYGTKGEEILYVTPAGIQLKNMHMICTKTILCETI